MSVKKRIPRFSKLYSFYEEKTEEFLDETDVDSHFYHNIFDICQPQHRKVSVSKVSNKKSSAIKSFHVCELKIEQRQILQEEVNNFKKELKILIDSLRDYLKTFVRACNCIQISSSKPKVDIESTETRRQSLCSLVQRYH